MGVGQSFFLSIDYCHRLRENRMNTQPEALRLAEWLETSANTRDQRAATALRRLHEVNQELVEALEEAIQLFNADFKPSWEMKLRWNEVLAKAKGEE
jgi:hypothetical protein